MDFSHPQPLAVPQYCSKEEGGVTSLFFFFFFPSWSGEQLGSLFSAECYTVFTSSRSHSIVANEVLPGFITMQSVLGHAKVVWFSGRE